MENNKVNVQIYGQEFTIAGDIPKEEIIQHAARVDMKMHEIADGARSAGASTQNVAILAAVNIASEEAQTLKELDEVKSMNVQLEKDAQHYVQLWDESKKTYSEYKEETQAIVMQKDELMNQLRAKDEEIAMLRAAAEESKNQIQSGMEDVIREVEGKCRELENSFFDLQMENLQLKKELDKYKNTTGQF
ncbi:MAG: cell division protein ZapA [Clostridia bacterium]|nr:cell division protein ZapA [Clostridia bacterium]